MNTQLPQKVVISIINQRKQLIKLNISKKNKAKCLVIISELQRYLDAYGKKYTEKGWKSFVKTHYNDLLYLIPHNKSRETIIMKLNQLL